MPAAVEPVELVHLGWRENGDSFDVALAVNRLLAGGARAWRLSTSRPPAEAGDYLIELTPAQARSLAAFGVRATRWSAGLAGAQLLQPPVVRLFAGTASKFPYFAYYGLALLRLGIDYVPCDGAALASGALDEANLLVLPGGFSTWGIDAAEDAPGADARVRAFLSAGGTAIGSCGGAYYLSAGRPGWTGTAATKPLYTHEYLQSGVGVVTLALNPGPLAFGCPRTIEVPYYHGPIYDSSDLLGSGIEVAATFESLSLGARLGIDNPLDHERFVRDMKGKPAILSAAGDRGRAVLFSPHPEMGDLIRKYIALDGYVRRYLPIRGLGTMRDTLRHYRVADAPSFRLVLNAVHELMAHARSPRASASAAGGWGPSTLPETLRHGVAALPASVAREEGALLAEIAAGIAARVEPLVSRSAEVMKRGEHLSRLKPAWDHLEATIGVRDGERLERTPAQALMELELEATLLECWTRVAETDLALAERT